MPTIGRAATKLKPLFSCLHGKSANPVHPLVPTAMPPITPNTIRARLSFSFKAEAHELESCIDLDTCRGEAGVAPNFHLLLARATGIDPYSYLYEVMEAHDIEFSEPTGVATLSCQNGQLDWAEFERHSREDRDMQVVSEIAKRLLGVPDLAQRPEIKAALLEAYRAGIWQR
jgi:hypothetical protein